MSKKDLILIGGGDHCSSCIDVIEQEGSYLIKGIIDKIEKIGQTVLGYPIIGTDDDLQELAHHNLSFFITIGHVRSAQSRIKIYMLLKKMNVSIPIIISPKAYVSKHSKIGEGTIIMPFSVIDVNVDVGNNCIINHHTTLGHEAIIDSHCHVSANCVLGKCKVGEGTFIGGNSWITNDIAIVPNTIIGSCSNVIKDILESGIYAGNPAKLLRRHE